jgi:hypothetical protein
MKLTVTTTQTTGIDAFLAKMKSSTTTPTGGGRLIFALDATASRQPTWDTACQLQTDMFREATGLAIQLVYYRGLSECRASRWVSQPEQLSQLMERLMCRSGETQIGKVLKHTLRETQLLKVQALVFVGDAAEENPDALAQDAATLGKVGVPAFMFQEGRDKAAKLVFEEIANLSHGGYATFDPGAAGHLRDLLRAVAAFAVGGLRALENSQNPEACKLLTSLKR